MIRHFLRLIDIGPAELEHLLSEAARLKADVQKGFRPPLLAGKSLGMVFEKPSLRTRVKIGRASCRERV